MILADMRFLIFCVIVTFPLLAQALPGEGGFDHEQLTTVEGRVFQDIFVVGTDASGLTFRHRRGIAKVPFTSLPVAYRMLYESVETPAVDEAQEMDSVVSGSGGKDWLDRLDAGPVVLTARNRVQWVLPGGYLRGIACGPPVPAWRNGWVDHAWTHRLSTPLWRGAVVRDFLWLSGLMDGRAGRY